MGYRWLYFPFRVMSKSNRVRFGYGGVYIDREVVRWEEGVRREAFEQWGVFGCGVISGEVEMVVYVRFRDGRRIDIANIPKSLTDALEGVVYYDDRQVRRLEVEIVDIGSVDDFIVGVKEYGDR